MSNREKIIGSILIVVCCCIFYFVGGISSKNSILSSSEFINDEYSIGEQNEGFSKDVEKQSVSSVNENLNALNNKNLSNVNESDTKIFVDIDGAVNKPGVYEVNEESRLVNLIELAGGLTDEAKTIGLNKAEKLKDGGYYYIAKIGEEPNDDVLDIINSEKKSNLININTATLEELTKLPGIGESKGKAIIDYRENVGKFKSIDDLANVSGIGDKTIEKLREFVDID